MLSFLCAKSRRSVCTYCFSHILLVDDVLTTGATLLACARSLRKAGAASVSGLTLARVLRDAP